MKYDWCPTHDTWEPQKTSCVKPEVSGGMIVMGDIEPFVSPVTGEVIGGRRQLRDHNRQNNVTNVADYKETWSRQKEQRARELSGYDPSRRGDISRAVDSILNGSKKR